ncbi:hypothetical protein IPC367_18980 [Pseudomonas aeruginosa]|uniref:hypothetical protein n=1 Tax=Pseudomonas aeruginosa group TaxID=136841 RepID=UPI00070B0927|nr:MULTISPECIES: hypothetical protein [Pseudomonas aeruginosa group]EMB4117878.1 hypothetical protein [Pseudomonas aeruginosa]MDI3608135.1 hypothetical protein [Pseudomonas aeruginosa]MDI3674900.1 hypothetical protein [Pseudomonas aeruginosa]MDI3705442.1 hypothetical protein [Pseudomonas aeruginosa]MDI3759520.1 hypothetical protein [Pseudomonas aeruginosa]
MTHALFDNADAAASNILRIQKQFIDALQSFADIRAHWRELGPGRLKSAITFDGEVKDGAVESGAIFGRPFRITALPYLTGNGVVAKYIVSVTDIAGKQEVRAVFLHSPGSDVVFEDGRLVVSRDDEYPNYLWLCNLIVSVLQTN